MGNQNNVDTHQCKRSCIWGFIPVNDERAVSIPLLEIIIIMLRTLMVLWQWLLRGQIWKAGVPVANKKNNIGRYVDPNIDSCISSNIGHNTYPDIGPYIGPDIHTYIGPDIHTYIGPNIFPYIGPNICPYIDANMVHILVPILVSILVPILVHILVQMTTWVIFSPLTAQSSSLPASIRSAAERLCPMKNLPFPSEICTFHVSFFHFHQRFTLFTY